MSVTINFGSSDERSVRVPIAGGLDALLESVRQTLAGEKGVEASGHLQLRTLNGSLLTEDNYSGLADGDSLEVLVVQATRMPPLQLLSSPGKEEEEEEEPPTKHSRLSTEFSPDWSNNPSTVSLQSAAVDSVRTPLSATLLSSPGVAMTSGAFVSQTFTFPVASVAALASPLCGPEFGYLQVPLTPGSGGAFILPSLVPVSPSFTSGPIAAAQVVVTANAAASDVYQSPSSGSKQQEKDIDLHLPEAPIESLFPDQATLSERLAYMKYLEEHPERKLSFSDFQEEFSQTASRVSRPRSNSLHRTDSQVMSTLNARLKQRVAGAMHRRRSEADIGFKMNGAAAPPLVKASADDLSGDVKRRKPQRRTSIAEMQVRESKGIGLSRKTVISNNFTSTPGPPPSLIPAHLVNQTLSSDDVLVPAPAGEVEVEIIEEKSDDKSARRFPSNGTLSEKLAYLKWRESVDEEEEDDLGYQKSAAGGVRVSISQVRDQQNSPISAFAEP